MKKIMVLILFLITTNVCYSQTRDELKKLLAYYLEKDDSLQIAKQIILKQDTILYNREASIVERDKQISSYQDDSTEYNKIITSQNKIISNKTEEINEVIKENKKKINNLRLRLAGAIIIIILETAGIILLL